ncbi:MAG: hypothetical protein ACOY3K_04950 [Candidatus Omnitrophota bacterium]
MKERLLNPVSVLLAGLALAGAGATGFFPGLIFESFGRMAYALMYVLVFFWVLVLCRAWRHAGLSFRYLLTRYGPGILFAIAISAVIFISNPPYLRVLSDESGLVSVSQSMAQMRTADTLPEAFQIGFKLVPVTVLIPIRPLLFPFLVHFLHGLWGYHVWNAFLLNFILLAVFLFLIWVPFERAYGFPWNYLAVLFVAAQPAIAESAASAGFDLCSLLLLWVCFLSLKLFLSSRDAPSFQLLWIHLLLFANVRYESILLAAFVLGALLLTGHLRKEYFRSSWLFAWTPILLLPTLWQRLLAPSPYLQLKNAVPFSWTYFIEHTQSFFAHLIASEKFVSSASIINLLGLGGLVTYGILFFASKWALRSEDRLIGRIAWLWALAQWILLCAFYYGEVTSPGTWRLFLPYFLALSLAAVLFLRYLRIPERRHIPLLIVGFLVFFLYHTLPAQHGLTNKINLPRRLRVELDFLKQYPTRDIVVITDRPGHLTIYGYGALTFVSAENFKKKVLDNYARFLHEHIFIVQEISLKDGKTKEETTLASDWPAEIVFQKQFTPTELLRISRVKRPAGKTEDGKPLPAVSTRKDLA